MVLHIASAAAGNGGTNVVLLKEKGGYSSHYVTGDDVVRITRRGLERHMGTTRYGEEFHRFLVAVALTKLGVKEGAVDLTLFAPPGLCRSYMAAFFHWLRGYVFFEAKNLLQSYFTPEMKNYPAQ